MGAKVPFSSLLGDSWLDNLSTLHELQFRAKLSTVGMTISPSCYPGSNVFINKLGISDPKLLATAEADFCLLRTEEYRRQISSNSFDLDHLRLIHYHLFQDIYDWAGQIRADDIRKNICEFTPAVDIETQALDIYQQLAAENYLLEYEVKQLIPKLARYYDLTNRLHPFSEGNGRVQRLFIEQLVNQCGYF